MKLLVDVGNSRIKGALQSDRGLKPLLALPYKKGCVAEALVGWSDLSGIECCWVASVGHADTCKEIETWVRSRFSAVTYFVASDTRACGVISAYAKPENLGVDRWLGMIAARAESQSPAIIVSAGTAVTIDVVDATGQHRGGLIAPGLTTQRKAMLEHTQVRADTSNEHLDLLGDSTDACVTLGTLHAVLGYIERVMRQLQSEREDWVQILAGGDAEQLLPHLGNRWRHRPMLVLDGLAVMSRHKRD